MHLPVRARQGKPVAHILIVLVQKDADATAWRKSTTLWLASPSPQDLTNPSPPQGTDSRMVNLLPGPRKRKRTDGAGQRDSASPPNGRTLHRLQAHVSFNALQAILSLASWRENLRKGEGGRSAVMIPAPVRQTIQSD